MEAAGRKAAGLRLLGEVGLSSVLVGWPPLAGDVAVGRGQGLEWPGGWGGGAGGDAGAVAQPLDLRKDRTVGDTGCEPQDAQL